MAYNPFEKNISELNSDDLNTLIEKEVAEGYYIEYKSNFPNAKKIAKSIAALTNSYGGWFFVGIKEDKKNNAAIEITGINLKEHIDPISTVRDAIRHHISPVPIFNSIVIDLPNGYVVVAVHVPEDQEGPLIHKDGSIYRRISDSSEPIKESNRTALDRIYERGKEARARFEEFCRDESIYIEKKENVAWIKIFLSPYTEVEVKNLNNLTDTNGIGNLMKMSNSPIQIPFGMDIDKKSQVTAKVEFNAGHTTHNSVILKRVSKTNPCTHGPIFELFLNGKVKIFIPVGLRPAKNLCQEGLKSQGVSTLIQRYTEKTEFHFFDIGKLWLTVGYLITFYFKCLTEVEDFFMFKAAIKIENIMQVVPLLSKTPF
jgi:Schlafen, AlbA_2